MKVCLVTTGATAPFTKLILSILSSSSISALQKAGYTHLLIQYGTAKSVFEAAVSSAQSHLTSSSSSEPSSDPSVPKRDGLIIDGIDFAPHELRSEFILVQQTKGIVISHAGSGSILAALRYQIPLVVVPNEDLADNHQVDLAVAMEKGNYLVTGDVRNLEPAIEKAEKMRDAMARFPPITSGKHRETKSFAAIMDETMGLE